MKKTLLLTLLLCVSCLMNAAGSKTVNVTTAGGLSGLISTAEQTTITNLTVTGSIDASDVKFMRDDMTVLADINLAGANVMAFSGGGGTYPYDYTYAANEMPTFSFYKINEYVGKVTLKNITLPNTLTSIGKGTFEGCNGLTSITLPNTVTSIKEAVFNNCTGLTSIILPNSLTSIEDYAFNGCTGLTSITLPNSLTSIGDYVFWNCNRLTSINLPNMLTSIGDGAFRNCSGLTSITIPSTLTSISGFAFYNCTGLQKISVAHTVPPTIKESTFGGVNKVTCELVVLTGKTSSYQAVDYWKLFGLISESSFATDVRPTPAQQVASVKVYVANQSIVVKGAPQGEGVAVYGLNGVLMQSEVSQGNDLMIPVDAGAIYLVKVGGQTFKVAF